MAVPVHNGPLSRLNHDDDDDGNGGGYDDDYEVSVGATQRQSACPARGVCRLAMGERARPRWSAGRTGLCAANSGSGT